MCFDTQRVLPTLFYFNFIYLFIYLVPLSLLFRLCLGWEAIVCLFGSQGNRSLTQQACKMLASAQVDGNVCALVSLVICVL